MRGCLKPLANTCTEKLAGTFGNAPSGRGTIFTGLPVDFSGSVATGAGRSDGFMWRATPGASTFQPANAAFPVRTSVDCADASVAAMASDANVESVRARMPASGLLA